MSRSPTRRTVQESATDTILETEVPPAVERLAYQYVDACPYTTTAFAGIYMYLVNNDDEEGGKMLLDFMKQFAKHEAGRL